MLSFPSRSFSLVSLVAILACSGKTNDPLAPRADAGPETADELPPEICRTPTAPTGQWFTEITDEVGFSTAGARRPMGTGTFTGDLDGDGYDDLLTSFFPPGREPESSPTHTRLVMMNRPAPDDPSGKKRVFVDATYTSGLMATRDGVGGRSWGNATLGDLDNDGTLDVILCPAWVQDSPSPDGCSAFKNDGTGHFTLFDASELDVNIWSAGAGVMLDYDRDGALDFFPSSLGQWNGKAPSRMRLYKGAGDGSFRNVAKDVGLPTSITDSATQHARRIFGLTTCDLDGDGDQDLLVAMYGRDDNYVFRNDGGKFVEIGESLGLAHDDKLDFTDDQSYRCYCKNNPGTCDASVPAPPSSAYCAGFGDPSKNGRGWEPGYTDSPHHLGGNNFGITCGDIDDDGDLDVMTAETMHADVGSASDRSELIVNVTPPGQPLKKLERPGAEKTGLLRTYPAGDLNWNEGDNAAVFVDLDFDGRKDIYLASSNYPGTHGWTYRQKADGTFEDVTKISGIGQISAEGPAFIDIDNDGDLDLVLGVGTFNGAAKDNNMHVYRNDIGQNGNWSRIKLVGKGLGHANVSGIGARVKITAGGRTISQEVIGTNGHGGGLGLTLTFGLGAACSIDKIEVRWPDAAGTVTTYEKVRANYRIVLTEGEPKPKYLR